MASPNYPDSNSKEVSAMIKQGFISDPYRSPPPTISGLSPSRVYLSPPPSCSSELANCSRSARQNPTLFEMMSEEQTRESKQSVEARHKIQENVSRVLESAPFRKSGNWGGFGDVKLTITGRDGFRVSMDVHTRVLADRSRFFAEKFSGDAAGGVSHSVEICDCDDVVVYVEALVLMYSNDLKSRLMGQDVSKVLSLLKVSDAIKFDAGVMSCLEYLEAVPWSEEEEEKVISHLTQLQLPNSAPQVLQRVAPVEESTSSGADDVFLELLTAVLQAKDEKARREMKTLVSRLLTEEVLDINHIDRRDISKDVLYLVCQDCLSSLVACVSQSATTSTASDDHRHDGGVAMGEIAREADNMEWIVDILVRKKMGDGFVKLWADQKEIAVLHSKIPVRYRHGISRITAQLCVAIGRGTVLVPKDIRFAFLSTWLEALYEDFAWMSRASRSIDKKQIEDGLSQTILTLSLPQQQVILLNWFSRFLNKGDDCPNIQRAFEVWWRRAFVKQYAAEPQLQLVACDYPS